MPWKEVKPMDQKLLFIADHLREVTTFSDLCHRYGISSKTGYKWVARYEKFGIEGLQDQSLEETAFLLRSPKNARRLLESLVELEQGGGVEKDLVE